MSTTQLVPPRESSRPEQLAQSAAPPGLLRLMGVEWMRLRSRRAFWGLLLLAFLGIGLSLGTLARNAQPPSAAEIAAAEELVAAEIAQPYFQEELQRCEDATAAGDESIYGPGFDCDDLLPRAEWYYSQQFVELVPTLGDVLVQMALTFGLAGLLVGATFAGADWSAGTIGTQLLFEPRRGRLFAAKAAVVGLALAAAAAVAAGGVALVVYLVASAWGSTEGATAARGDLVLAALRAVLAVGAGGAVGVALGLALRRSVAVVGIVFAYLFLGEGLVRGGSPDAEPWLVSSRLTAWLQRGGLDLERYPDSCNFGPCEPVITHISTTAGGVYLAVGAVALVLGSYAVFRRRDVG